MKNNIYYLIIFLFLFNCSTKNEDLVDINFLKKQGNQIIIEKENLNLQSEVKKILNLSLYESFNLKDWYHEYFQASNFLPHTQYSGNFNQLIKKKLYSHIKENENNKQILSIDKKIYYVDDIGDIYSLNFDLIFKKKFKLYKKKYFGDYNLKFSLATDGTNIFIADNLGNIYSYDPKNNKIIWSSKLGVPFLSNIVYYKNNIYIINDNGKIYSFDSKSGKQNWSFDSATNLFKNPQAFQLAIENDKLIFSNDLGDLYCIDLEKRNLIWSINLKKKQTILINDELFALSKIVMKDDDVFVSTSENQFFNIKIINGQVNWIINLPSPSLITPLITTNNLISISKNGYLIVLNKIDGQILFRKKIDLNSLKSKKKKINENYNFNYNFISSNKLILSTDIGYFVIINLDDLNNIVLKKVSNSINTMPVTIFNNIYFLDKKGFIYKL